jgi:hypothetical protein
LWPGRNPKRYDPPADLVPLKDCEYKGDCNHSYMCQRCYNALRPSVRVNDRLLDLAEAAYAANTGGNHPTSSLTPQSTPPSKPPQLQPLAPLNTNVPVTPSINMICHTCGGKENVKATPLHSAPNNTKLSPYGRAARTLDWKLKAAKNRKSPANKQIMSRTTRWRLKRDLPRFAMAKNKRSRRHLNGGGRKPTLVDLIRPSLLLLTSSAAPSNEQESSIISDCDIPPVVTIVDSDDSRSDYSDNDTDADTDDDEESDYDEDEDNVDHDDDDDDDDSDGGNDPNDENDENRDGIDNGVRVARNDIVKKVIRLI